MYSVCQCECHIIDLYFQGLPSFNGNSWRIQEEEYGVGDEEPRVTMAAAEVEREGTRESAGKQHILRVSSLHAHAHLQEILVLARSSPYVLYS